MFAKWLAVGVVAVSVWMSGVVQADEANPKVKQSMEYLISEAAKLGAPRIEGSDLYFGTTKMNENYALVDDVKTKHGGTATLFIKKDNAYMRISTNVMKNNARAIGTQLDPNGPAIGMIRDAKAYYGIVDILGKLFDTGYEPIKNAQGEVIGIYYVGYLLE